MSSLNPYAASLKQYHLASTYPYQAATPEGTLFDVAPISQMFIATYLDKTGYARPIRPSWVKKLVSDWDVRKMSPVILSLRPDGQYAIIDGCHRVEAARRVGMTHLPAFVYLYLCLLYTSPSPRDS